VAGRWTGRAPRGPARDATLAGVSLAGGLVLLSLDAYNTVWPPAGRPASAYALPLVAVSIAVLLRRTSTAASLSLGTAAAAADLALGGSLGTLLIYTQVLYDACVYGPPRLWRWLVGITVGAAVAGALVGVAGARSWQGLWLGVLLTLIGVLPVLTGVTVRHYRDQAAAERARAEQTARLAELDRRQAVLAERTRMARELHDVVANHLSAVAIHATAALAMADGDEGVRRALGVIRSSGVQGLAEMRRMIGLLRDADDPGGASLADPAGAADPDGPVLVGLDGADALVERARSAGLEVSLRIDGPPRPLPVAVGLAAYRILQEALTNALKHGDGRADAAVAYADDHLAVTVANPCGSPGHPAVPGAGAGLIGMRERTDLLAGRFTAGPVDGVWRVRAELPVQSWEGA
jgi:signal transduction histidine kinase